MTTPASGLTAFGRALLLPGDESLGEWPILAVAASCWEPERIRAFETVYDAMRRVDDLVDNARKSARPLTSEARARLGNDVRRELRAVSGEPLDDRGAALLDVTRRFTVPAWPWQRWTSAMLHDVWHEGFETCAEFRRYCLGAAGAPGAIFLHLAAAPKRGGREGHAPPSFDVDAMSRPLALFAYSVHLLRDFRHDQAEGLNPVPRSLLAAVGLREAQLRDFARRSAPGNSDPMPAGLVTLLHVYLRAAEHYRRRARLALDALAGLLEPCGRLSVEIVYDLYLQLLEKAQASPLTGLPDLVVNPTETRERLRRNITRVEQSSAA